jgi:hypothetical protein
MTPADIIVDVRRMAQDNGLLRSPDTYIQSTLLGYTNQTLKHIATLRPDLFTLMGDIPTQPSVVEQVMPVDSARLVNILAVKDGPAIFEVSRQMMDYSYPQWRSEPAGLPVNYMRHPQNPNRYFLYPKPQVGVVLTGEYVQAPPAYAEDQHIDLLPDSFLPTVVSGVLMLIAGTENPTKSNERYVQFEKAFIAALQTNMKARTLTDKPDSGVSGRPVE